MSTQWVYRASTCSWARVKLMLTMMMTWTVEFTWISDRTYDDTRRAFAIAVAAMPGHRFQEVVKCTAANRSSVAFTRNTNCWQGAAGASRPFSCRSAMEPETIQSIKAVLQSRSGGTLAELAQNKHEIFWLQYTFRAFLGQPGTGTGCQVHSECA